MLGPWPASGTEFPLAVAVSGGADSTALAVLSAEWAAARGAVPHALVVDHRLRPESGAEAALTGRRMTGLGFRTQMLPLEHLPPGPGLSERARRARYAALDQASAAIGALELLLGHHRRDQAETVAIRIGAGSGAPGLAAMAVIAPDTRGVRRLRPLLDLPPERLRATLQERGIPWVEDPSNADPRFERARLRARFDPAETALLAGIADARGEAREARAAAAAAWCARHVTLSEHGFLTMTHSSGPADPWLLARLVQTVSGRRHPPPVEAAARLFAAGAGTLAGTLLGPAGKLGPGLLLCREPAALAEPVALRAGGLWDGRFLVEPFPDDRVDGGLTLGALGSDAEVPGLPARVRHGLPVIREGRALLALPTAGWQARPGRWLPRVRFRPPVRMTEAASFRVRPSFGPGEPQFDGGDVVA